MDVIERLEEAARQKVRNAITAFKQQFAAAKGDKDKEIAAVRLLVGIANDVDIEVEEAAEEEGIAFDIIDSIGMEELDNNYDRFTPREWAYINKARTRLFEDRWSATESEAEESAEEGAEEGARGKGKAVHMKPSAYFKEHKKLVNLLTTTSKKLAKEGKEQMLEAKTTKAKLKGGVTHEQRKRAAKAKFDRLAAEYEQLSRQIERDAHNLELLRTMMEEDDVTPAQRASLDRNLVRQENEHAARVRRLVAIEAELPSARAEYEELLGPPGGMGKLKGGVKTKAQLEAEISDLREKIATYEFMRTKHEWDPELTLKEYAAKQAEILRDKRKINEWVAQLVAAENELLRLEAPKGKGQLRGGIRLPTSVQRVAVGLISGLLAGVPIGVSLNEDTRTHFVAPLYGILTGILGASAGVGVFEVLRRIIRYWMTEPAESPFTAVELAQAERAIDYEDPAAHPATTENPLFNRGVPRETAPTDPTTIVSNPFRRVRIVRPTPDPAPVAAPAAAPAPRAARVSLSDPLEVGAEEEPRAPAPPRRPTPPAPAHVPIEVRDILGSPHHGMGKKKGGKAPGRKAEVSRTLRSMLPPAEAKALLKKMYGKAA